MSESATEQGMMPPEREVFSVSRLNQTARTLLEQGLARVWIEGELSNIARPSSGHLYFTLKDSQAQVRGAMFRSRNQLLRFRPEEGMQVLVRAKVSLYEARGDYQLIAESMQEAGDGVLQRAFDALKEKLEAEGLFDAAGKKTLPALPTRIGVITSPTGAAIRDVLSVLRRRFPAIPVLIYPVPVQGKDAGNEIAAMLHTAANRNECDVLIVTRGGGSLEDLWAFNEETVARALHACHIPVVSAVGHEVDFTIADFVADQRAPTPSAAAELLSPDQGEWLQQVTGLAQRITRHMQQRAVDARQRMTWLEQRLKLRHPGQHLRQQAQRLDELEGRMRLATRSYFNNLRASLQVALAALKQQTPTHRIHRTELQRHALEQRLHTAIHTLLQTRQRQLAVACRSLDTISPLATLQRGYAIVSRPGQRKILRTAADIKPGEQVETRLADGKLLCTVDEVKSS
ncbi:MAG: exodeoxyribonuclease VII large subunit [Gammaproteobacteria bacterium]|nr:exodeoxyribonuclease VII large subunit [Gammaproteobacteria bacterium]